MKNFFLLLFACYFSLFPQRSNSERPWKGNAILGNGNLCVVYSDDARIKARTNYSGLQHFYFNDYTVDYIASSSFELSDENGNLEKGKEDIVDLKNFFTARTKSFYKNGIQQEITCFVHQKDAVVLSSEIRGNDVKQRFSLLLRKNFVSDRTTSLVSLTKERNIAVAVWSNNISIAVASTDKNQSIEVNDSLILFSGNATGKVEYIIAAGASVEKARQLLRQLLSEKNLSAATAKYWTDWMMKGKLPKFKKKTKNSERYLEFYKQTLYAVKSACLNGQIPADMTGQFVTNNMPQLYPRDAMMSARVFLKTRHYEEAKSIIKFWGDKKIPKKSKGEFFARYDAYAQAVDAGSGARYDEPEWDANAFFIQLANWYHQEKNEWLADKNFLYELADLFVNKIDHWGLLYEGGMVEWTGYLPLTNMECAAALKTISDLAKNFGDYNQAKKYSTAGQTITENLYRIFDTTRNTFAAVRFTGIKAQDGTSLAEKKGKSMFLWDGTSQFAALWGFQNSDLIKRSVQFSEKNRIVLNGGLQYFEASDNAWLSGYGGDAFFFTTAALAQYYSLTNQTDKAKKHIDWMIKNANIYGLMPERIYLNQSDCADASPLTWCNAEFALAVLTWSENL
ncbi:MAG: hypothetical protein WCS69_02965 [Ignavibacteriaceae bacterium]